MLAKKYRINKRKEYAYLYKHGKKTNGKYIFIYFTDNHHSYNRFGIVTSKIVGKAVKRNKAKRILRAVIKCNPLLPGRHINIVIVATKRIKQATYEAIEQDYKSVMKKADLW